MDLLHALGTFIRIVETGSFSATAREQNVGHSSVTRLVGQLEDHFGMRLFQRTTRRLNLTEDGQTLLAYASQVMEAAEDMEGALRQQRGSPSGVVRVGLPVGAAALLVPRLPALLAQYPNLSVEFVVGDQFDDLIAERLDVALRIGQPADVALVARAIGTFGRAVVAAPSYLERRGAPARPADLAEHTCLVHAVGPDSAYWRFTGPDGPQAIRISGAFLANNSEVVRLAAVAGHGIAKLSEAQVIDDIRSARLYRLLADYPSERHQAFIVYPSRRHLAPRTRVVIDFLVERLRAVEIQLADGRTWGESETTWLV
jgi:DNA-binding transcriptional LysR family regulator